MVGSSSLTRISSQFLQGFALEPRPPYSGHPCTQRSLLARAPNENAYSCLLDIWALRSKWHLKYSKPISANLSPQVCFFSNVLCFSNEHHHPPVIMSDTACEFFSTPARSPLGYQLLSIQAPSISLRSTCVPFYPLCSILICISLLTPPHAFSKLSHLLQAQI